MRTTLKASLLAFFIVINSIVIVGLADFGNIKVIVDGKQLTMDVEPISQDGRTLIPLKAVMQALDAKVDWDEKTESISVTKDTTRLNLKLNSTEALLNGKKLALDVPPITINNRTMVPVRFVSENLGVYVEWNEDENAVIIDSSIEYEKIYNKDNELVYEGGYKNGKAFGNGKSYYTNGNLQYEGRFEDGIHNGYGIVYRDTGVIWAEGNWKDGDLTGKGKVYYESGKLGYEGDLNGAKADGKGMVYWEETGNIHFKGDFYDDFLEGYGWVYNENGILEAEGQFVKGELTGKGFVYYENGNLRYSGDFVNNMLEGYGKIYTESGDLLMEGEFEGGKANGKCIVYSNGMVVFVGEFKDNKPVE